MDHLFFDKFNCIISFFPQGFNMIEMKKTCKVHGELAIEDISVQKQKANKSGYQLRCKKCRLASYLARAGNCSTHGKLSEEDTRSDGRCAICHRESANKKRNNNREWFNEKMAKDREKNPEKWKNRYQDLYRKKIEKFGSESITTKEIVRRHKLTVEQYEEMMALQDNKCAICYMPETRKNGKTGKVMRLCLDHCHETNVVRGLLCHACNTAIGKFKDSVELLELAIVYLDVHQKRMING